MNYKKRTYKKRNYEKRTDPIKPFRDNNKRKKRITISERKGQKYNLREKRIIIRVKRILIT